MKIMPYNVFVKNSNSTVILLYHRKLVSHYISKVFVIPENNSNVFKDVLLRIKQQINSEDLHKNDFVMARNRETPSEANTLKNESRPFLDFLE